MMITSPASSKAGRCPRWRGWHIRCTWKCRACVRADYAQAASRTIGVEFCGTSITSRSVGNEKIPEVLAENPHFVFADSERRGYGVVEFTPRRLTTALRVVSDVARDDSGIETLAQFSVPAGRPEIETT